MYKHNDVREVVKKVKSGGKTSHKESNTCLKRVVSMLLVITQ